MNYIKPMDHVMPSILTFGKYKGKSIKWVIINDYPYLVWAYKNVKNFPWDKAEIVRLVTKYRTIDTRRPGSCLNSREYDNFDHNSFYLESQHDGWGLI